MPDPSAPHRPEAAGSPHTTAHPSGGGPPPPVVYAMPPQEKKRGGFLSKLAGSAILSLLVISLLANLYMGLILSSIFGTNEKVYAQGETDKRVVVLPVVGGIDAGMASYVRESIQKLEDDLPAALVLRVDSGGGGVTPSDEIWKSITTFRVKHPEIPVIASFGGVAASGGYYIAMPADLIFAEPTCITGSIGVMAPAFTIGGLLEKIGVQPEILVADGSPRKDVANDITKPFNEQDREVFKTILNAAYERFADVVVQGRTTAKVPAPPTEAEVRLLCDGRIFTAKQALEQRMVDELGYLDDAVAKAAELAGMPAGKQPKVTTIQREYGLVATLFNANAARGESLRLSQLDPEQLRTFVQDMTATQLMYRIPLR